MSRQADLTRYYKVYKSGKLPEPMENKTPKRKLSLKKRVQEDSIIVLSSEDENNELNSSQGSVEETSDCSAKTIIYSVDTPTKEKPSTSGLKSSPKTPTSVKRSLNSPSSNKYFSPNKKRSVSKKSPNKAQRNLNSFFLAKPKSLDTNDADELYIAACDGQDDKTKFLLKIVNDFLKQESLRPFLDEQSVTLLSNFFKIPKPAAKLVCRLYWRKHGWYKLEQIVGICSDGKDKDSLLCNDVIMADVLKALVEHNFVLLGNKNNMTFNDFSNILKADELKVICKTLKLKTQSKKSAVESLQEFCKRSSISNFFMTNNNTENNYKRVMQIFSEKTGPCYCLSELAKSTLYRLYILTYLGIGYDVIREKRLELMLINEKIKRETFPVSEDMKLDDASVVFQDRDEFERYLSASDLYEEFLTSTDLDHRCLLVMRAYAIFESLGVEHIVRYKSLPSWLQRFTPPNIYVKILALGVQDLKRVKSEKNNRLAVEILTSLINQTFRCHKRAEWFAEKALILHTYLNDSTEAAHTLLQGFESTMSDEAKDVMRPRAKKIATQKNITLDESTREILLKFANKETILECNIPSQHFYKQPMDNVNKGKAMYETKSDSGRTLQGVEEYALSCYRLNEEYTNGGHWEERIITTMFFLLFWDIIYTKPKSAEGVFLSKYQRYPLDMFNEDFYANRRTEIDQRLKRIEECSPEEVVELMMIVYDDRPECEISGISRDISRDEIASCGACLSGRKTAGLCRRLAENYRYWHSGFPDLTMWNESTKKIKFVEVKSDNDKPSMKQIQWMQHLMQLGIDTEFCYVGVNTTRAKSRQPKKDTVS